mmetsp:Transcript_20207/g.29744  ORF Transcript_20207/g.29744 Transcript_20207/m.29744 type:complete len:135 (-) Transcript_20207:232-636(-)
MRFSSTLLLILPWLSLAAGDFLKECAQDGNDIEECMQLDDIRESIPSAKSGSCSDQYKRAMDRCSTVPTCRPCIDTALRIPKRKARSVAVKGCTTGVVCGNTAIWKLFPRCISAGGDLATCTYVFGSSSTKREL